MFVRAKKVGKYTYLQLVENKRVEGKTRQRVVATLGRLDQLEKKGGVEALVLSLARFSHKVKVQGAYEQGDLEALWDHLRAHPRDHEARLTLARAMWQAGRYEESLEAYSRLLRANKLVDEVLADLEGYAEERPSDAGLLRVLGDAYMRADRLTEALEAYREALKNL